MRSDLEFYVVVFNKYNNEVFVSILNSIFIELKNSKHEKSKTGWIASANFEGWF